MRWIEKWLTLFRIVTTSSVVTQSSVKIKLRAPVVWCEKHGVFCLSRLVCLRVGDIVWTSFVSRFMGRFWWPFQHYFRSDCPLISTREFSLRFHPSLTAIVIVNWTEAYTTRFGASQVPELKNKNISIFRHSGSDRKLCAGSTLLAVNWFVHFTEGLFWSEGPRAHFDLSHNWHGWKVWQLQTSQQCKRLYVDLRNAHEIKSWKTAHSSFFL